MIGGKRKRVILCVMLPVLLLFLWGVGPGPAVLARATAESYAARYAPDYSYHALVLESEAGLFRVRDSFWIVLLSQEDRDLQGPVLRLELNGGLFPTRVEQAGWWVPEPAMDRPEIPLPVPG